MLIQYHSLAFVMRGYPELNKSNDQDTDRKGTPAYPESLTTERLVSPQLEGAGQESRDLESVVSWLKSCVTLAYAVEALGLYVVR